MRRYTLVRLLLMLPVLLGVTLVVFLVMSLVPGDPALAILGPYADAERLAALRADLGLDQGPAGRYLTWLGNLLQGDLGHSLSLQRPVADLVMERIGPTLLLAGSALVVGCLVGIGAGLTAALRRDGPIDRLVTALVLLGISTPAFWLGLLLILVFGVRLDWLPVSGMTSVHTPGGLPDLLAHLLLPTLSLALAAGGVIARLARGAAIELLGQPHIHLLQAQGLHPARIIGVNLMKALLARLAPVIALQAGFLIGGAVYIETLFQWPGIGRLLVDAIAARDLPLVQGGVLVLAMAYVLVNLIADLYQHWQDPRTRPA